MKTVEKVCKELKATRWRHRRIRVATIALHWLEFAYPIRFRTTRTGGGRSLSRQSNVAKGRL